MTKSCQLVSSVTMTTNTYSKHSSWCSTEKEKPQYVSCPLQYLICLFQIPFTKVNPSLQNFEINEFHDFEESWFSVIDSYTIRKPRSVFMPSKVPFQVVYCSSSDDNHREKELEVCVSFFIVFRGRFLLAMQELEPCVNWKPIQIQEHVSVGARPYAHWNKGHCNCVCTFVCASCRVKV